MRNAVKTICFAAVLCAVPILSVAASGPSPATSAFSGGDCPTGSDETTREARLALEVTAPAAVASRQRLGVDHLGPDDVRLLRDPADSAACRLIRSHPLVADTDPDPDDVILGFYQVGNLYIIGSERTRVRVLPSGALRVRKSSSTGVSVYGQDGTYRGGISW